MSSNAIGTVLIAGFLLVILLFGWFLFSTSIYFLITIILNLEFSLIKAIYLFLGMMIVKAFYPKNVFV
jgi:hypothetical protein